MKKEEQKIQQPLVNEEPVMSAEEKFMALFGGGFGLPAAA